VLNTNDAPVAEDDSVTTAEDTPVVVDVVANDLDLDGDVLVISATGPAAHGVVSLPAAPCATPRTPTSMEATASATRCRTGRAAPRWRPSASP
jgi:hypothetical protein